ncbi:MAG TPA: hypothetical protein DCZ95_06935 [Verrucomicrobia bacterium]|nr:MAG: hypothetical protein A2X46_06160 [Lentisphaerae bacterium GWF2_57_35]HBA83810.1 hypothetical protein [Verrucomicrobiota bacterium]
MKDWSRGAYGLGLLLLCFGWPQIGASVTVVCEPQPGLGHTDEDNPPGPYGFHPVAGTEWSKPLDFWYEVTPSAGEAINRFVVFTGVQYDGDWDAFENFYQPTGWVGHISVSYSHGVRVIWRNQGGVSCELPEDAKSAFGFDHTGGAEWNAWQTELRSAYNYSYLTNGYGYLVHSPGNSRSGVQNLYVSTNGLNVHPYTNWVMAARDIQSAVNAAMHGAVIHVSNGLYRITNEILIDLSLRLESVNGPSNTVVDAGYPASTSRCFHVTKTNAFDIEGFTITGGRADSGGGIFLKRGSIGDCVIVSNSARQGGGVYVEYWGMATITACRVSANWAEQSGGGLYFRDATGLIRDCLLDGNRAADGGGACGGGNSEFRNCLVARNVATNMGGGLMLGGCAILNCTISDNSAAQAGGLFAGAAYQRGWADNTIIYSNSATNGADVLHEGASWIYSRSCLGTGFANQDIMTNAPLFADRVNGDYRLSSGSPCIDAGSNQVWMATAEDLAGSDRVSCGYVDMGAYEFKSDVLRCNFSADSRQGLASFTNVFRAFCEGTNTSVQYYGWDFDGNGSVDVSGAGCAVATGVYHDVGWYSPILTVSNTAGENCTIQKQQYIKVAPSTVYVSTNGGHVYPYASWLNAARDIQSAVDVSIDGSHVLAADGLYVLTNQIVVESGIYLESTGGFTHAVIDGGYPAVTNRCLSVNHPSAVVSGFHIRNGLAAGTEVLGSSGGGVLLQGGAVLQNCWIEGNKALGDFGVGGGGGICCWGDGRIESCLISSNTSLDCGGGVSMYGGFMDRCVISSNSAVQYGGGVYCSGRGVLRNSLIVGNSLPIYGGGVYCESDSDIQNCTIVDNRAYLAGGGLFGYVHLVENSIICSNRSGEGDAQVSGIVRYNCCGSAVSGEGNITNSPVFIDPASGNYRLAASSPCIDAGIAREWMTGAVDLDGNPRIRSCAVDMGAYEAVPGALSCRASVESTSGLDALTNVLTATLGGLNTNSVYYGWDFDGDGTNEMEGLGLAVVTNVYYPGSYTAILTVSNASGERAQTILSDVVHVGPSTLYVSLSGSHLYPYTSWAAAATSIQAAADAAMNGSTVFVTNGTYLLSSTIKITNSIALKSFDRQQPATIDGGGAVRCLEVTANALVDGFVLTRGRADNGGGLYCSGGTIQNCLLVGNTAANNGGGVYAEWSAILQNCTVCNNSASNSAGGIANSGATILNSIVCYNSASNQANCGEWGGQFSRSCSMPAPEGDDNFSADPYFRDPAALNYRLLPGSPCLDAGTNMAWMADATDLDGHARINDGWVDLGAYELHGDELLCNVVARHIRGIQPFTTILRSYVTGTNTQMAIFCWDLDQDGLIDRYGTSLNIVTGTYTKAGSHSIQLTVFNEAGERAVNTKTNYLFVGPAVAYVSAQGAHVFPYTNWTMAATNLHEALAAGADGTRVWVTNGVYAVSPALCMTNGITLASVNGPATTTLDGQFLNRCLSLYHYGAVVDGFRITRGYSTNSGGGAYLEAGLVRHCEVANNWALNWGGGVWMKEEGRLENCLIADNCALYAGGVFAEGGGELESCTIVDNQSESYGAVFFLLGGKMVNCVIYANKKEGYAPDDQFNVGLYGGNQTIHHCCSIPVLPGYANTSNDPQFVNAAASNFHLAATSPCRDVGSNSTWMVGAVDLDRLPRICNGIVDMGAYEWADTDADELPDWYEQQYTGHATNMAARGDEDGDGFLDKDEWNAGTDPLSAESFLGLMASMSELAESSSTGLVVRWSSVVGKVYSVGRSTNLVEGQWSDIAVDIPATPPMNTLTDVTAHGSGAYLYRIRVP